MPVMKGRTDNEVKQIYEFGFREFGENRLNELFAHKKKFADAKFHFIAPLQSRKIVEIMRNCVSIHTLSRKKEADIINENFTNQKKRRHLLNKCGLPDINETQHCFADGTHHTCCDLSPEARKYADDSGNPIGQLSKDVFEIYKKQKGTKNEDRIKELEEKNATPWCTCFGSKVCSYYASKFNDGTHIKFVNNPKSSTDAAFNPSPNCEGYFRQKFDVSSHGTPGINKVSGVNNSCSSELNKIN